jgi:hypothetical protein
MREILEADARRRRLALLLAIMAALAGAALLVYLQYALQQLAILSRSDPDLAMARVLMAVRLLAAALMVSVPALGAYLFRQGRRIRRAGQYPLPGVRVVRATPVVTGPGALVRGRLLQVLAVVLALIALLAGAMLLLVADLVAHGGA